MLCPVPLLENNEVTVDTALEKIFDDEVDAPKTFELEGIFSRTIAMSKIAGRTIIIEPGLNFENFFLLAVFFLVFTYTFYAHIK